MLALANHDHAARDFAFAVEFGDSAPHVGTDLDRGDIADRHGNTARRGANGHGAEIVEAFEIAAGAHDIFGLGHFDRPAAAFLVGALERLGHLLRGHAIGGELLRIDDHLILPHHAADARDLGDARHRLALEAQEPALEAAQFGEIVASALVDERIFVHPADPGR